MSAPCPWVEAFAPATVSNLGPGFDVLGLALRERGDRVRVRRRDEAGVVVTRIEGDGGLLPRDADKNTATVAVAALLSRHAAPGAGLELELYKGLPRGSGLGSSGASAAAAVVAAEAALGLGLSPEQRVAAARAGEVAACGSPHPDNVAPAIVGGIVLVAASDPLRLISLPVPRDLWLAVYTPGCEIETGRARALLPKTVPLAGVSSWVARMGLLVHALHSDDLGLLGEAMFDPVIEPVRAGLIPGYPDAKAACCEAGALGCTISGSGPTTLALASGPRRAEALLEILDETFTLAGVPGDGFVDQVGGGARMISVPLH